MMRRYAICAAVAFLALLRPAGPMTPEERRQYLEKLQQMLPDVPSFREWLQKTGEPPPDFDALPRLNDLPDPLRSLNGKPVRTPQEWNARRAEIKELFQKYALGTLTNGWPRTCGEEPVKKSAQPIRATSNIC